DWCRARGGAAAGLAWKGARQGAVRPPKPHKIGGENPLGFSVPEKPRPVNTPIPIMSATAIAVAVAIETLAIWTARVSGGAGLVWLDIARLALSTEVHNRIPHRLARYGAAGM